LRQAAIEKRLGVPDHAFFVHFPDDLFIASHLDIAAKQYIGDPAQRIKPVDHQQKKSERFPPMVTAPNVRALVANHAVKRFPG
jgi:hypothetical protein